MIRFRPYQQGDIEQFFDMSNFNKYDIAVNIIPENTWTALVENDEIIGCAGFRKMWNGVYDLWLIPKSYMVFYKYKLSVIRKIKYELNKLECHRIQAQIIVKNIKNIKLAEILGLKYEGTLQKFGPDKNDYHMYAMVK